MSALSDEQLTLLDNLIYYVSNAPEGKIKLYKGRSIELIVEESKTVLDNYGGKGYPAMMKRKEWEQILNAIEKDKTLGSYTIQNYEKDSNTESDTYNFCAATFVSPDKSDVNVIFRGTNGDLSEWTDNGAGGYSSDTIYQEKALKYIDALPFDGLVTVSGHSKGGNLSMYTAIQSDRVGRCVAIDGQGFSEEFIRKYTGQIGANRDKITLISAEKDFVNPLLYTIAGTCKFIQTKDPGIFKFGHYHKPNMLLDKNGNFLPEGEPSRVTSLVQDFSTYVNSCIPDEQRQEMIDKLTSVLAEEPSLADKAVNGIGGLMDVISSVPDYLGWNRRKGRADRKQETFQDEHEFENEEAIRQYLLEHTGDKNPHYLVRGALLHCRFGSHARKLNLLRDHGVYVQECPLVHEYNCETQAEKIFPGLEFAAPPVPPPLQFYI